MQKNSFDQVVLQIVKTDPRYQAAAYRFVREGLDQTLKSLKRNAPATLRHVSGPELLEGIRLHALNEYGPMTKLVMNDWGIQTCEDFGQIVFNLVNNGVLGKSDSDKMEDFSAVYTFEEAFVKPFLPTQSNKKNSRITKKTNSLRRSITSKTSPSTQTTPPAE